MFTFDTKGEFVTDDPEIINRAKGFFDHLELKAEPVGIKVDKTHVMPAITITTKDQEDPNTENKKHCKKCDFTCDKHGELLQHYKEHHPKGVE